jgi:hypothetical protein
MRGRAPRHSRGRTRLREAGGPGQQRRAGRAEARQRRRGRHLRPAQRGRECRWRVGDGWLLWRAQHGRVGRRGRGKQRRGVRQRARLQLQRGAQHQVQQEADGMMLRFQQHQLLPHCSWGSEASCWVGVKLGQGDAWR